MTSAEKILAGIHESAEAEAQKILADARQQADERLALARRDAEREATAIRTENERQAQVIRSTGISGAAVILRDAALSCRRELIETALKDAVEEIYALPDAEYFALLLSVLRQNGCTKGEVLLADDDVRRDRSSLKEQLTAMGLTLSAQTVPGRGGFVLRNGDIEINALPEALIRERHDELVDQVNRDLFGEE